MGDRIGVVFIDRNGDDSFVLQSHWAGRALLIDVQKWMREVDTEKIYASEAIARFLTWYGRTHDGDGDFCIQESDDDTEDNGVFIADLKQGVIG